MRRSAALISGLCASVMPVMAHARDMADMKTAVLQGLDKVTARISRLEVPVGQRAAFGTLVLDVAACRKAPPDETPESAAFLKISDARPGEMPVQVFSGWMFASSPALSALDHPVYDIWVLDCKDPVNPEPAEEAAPVPEQPAITPPASEEPASEEETEEEGLALPE